MGVGLKNVWRRSSSVLLSVILVGLLVGTIACSGGGNTGPELQRGTTAPDFTLTDIDGNRVKLSSFRGQPVVVNFWSISCPPCRVEMPEFEAVYQKYRDRAVFIGISPSDTERDVRDYVRSKKFSWKFVTDHTNAVSFSYEIAYFPTTYFIDKEGLITSVFVGGPLSQKTIETALQDSFRGVR